MNNKRLFLITHFSFWIIFIAISIWIFSHFLSFRASVLRTCLNAIPLAVLVYLNIWNVNNNYEQKKYFKAIIIALFIVFIPLRYFINTLPGFSTNLGLPTKKNTVLIGIILTNLALLVFSFLYQVLINRFKKSKQQSIEILTHQKAQLQYLRSQINPHFLFNTLNNIYTLSLLKSDLAPKMILKLSEMLRYLVYEQNENKVYLEKEIKMIENFIALAKLKYNTTKTISFLIQGDTHNLLIEPMILIPIVENCFKHSDIDINDKGYIKIELSIKENSINFSVINSKNDNLQQKDAVGGVGLENIKKRLQLTYPKTHLFKVTNSNTFFSVFLQIKV